MKLNSGSASYNSDQKLLVYRLLQDVLEAEIQYFYLMTHRISGYIATFLQLRMLYNAVWDGRIIISSKEEGLEKASNDIF
jgi:hypothetical protein